MEKFVNKKFVNETIAIDGKEFIDCVFDSCLLEFSATDQVIMTDNEIKNCTFKLLGAASLTASFFGELFTNMGPSGREMVEGFFNNYATTPTEKGAK